MQQLDHLPRLLDRLEREQKALAQLEQDTNETIGSAIRRERMELCIQQNTLATALGVRQAHLSAMENPGYRARWSRQHLANAIAYLRAVREQRPKPSLRQKIKAIFT
jgi:DNA-binding XRE family transcriptional regulator